MTAATADLSPAVVGTPIEIKNWALLAMALGLFAAYVVLQENGLLINSWMTVHEFFHDGRHALGFPCH